MYKMFFVLTIFVLIILLQVLLSTRKAKWIGLILPSVFALFSVMLIISNAYLFGSNTLTTTLYDENGAVVSETVEEMDNDRSLITNIAELASLLFVTNIPTAILLGVHFACREKVKRNSGLDKMTIQDLE